MSEAGDNEGGVKIPSFKIPTKILTVVGTAIATAILGAASAYLWGGGVIRTLGGVSVSQIIDSPPAQKNLRNCGDQGAPVRLSSVKKSFCFLTDISIRVGNSIDKNEKNTKESKDGWTICKIEKGEGADEGYFVLIAKMDGNCHSELPGPPEIACWARCIEF